MATCSYLSKAALACAIALALPGSALAAAPSLTGSTSVTESAGKATYTFDCGDTPNAIPILPAVPNVGPLTVAVAGGPPPAATQDADFGAPSTTTITCPPVGPATIDVPIVDDALDEANERFTVRITGTLAAVGGNPPSTPVDQTVVTTITDDDVPDASVTELVRVSEGDSAQLTVTLSQVPVEAATIAYATEASSALAGSDFSATSGELVIPAGQRTGTISVPIVDDDAVEKVEAFYVNLSSAVNATLNPSKKQAGVAVFDNDRPPVPALSLPKAVTVREGNSGTVNALFTVTLSSAAAERVQVAWKTANFSANLADYAHDSGTLVFAAGQTTKTISVNVKGDLRDEPNEAFGVVLERPAGATLAAARSFGIITDDDGPKMTLSKPKRTKRALVTTLRCPASADRCTGSLVATAGKLKVGKARFALAKGAGGKVKVKLSRKARAVLRKRALRVKLTVNAADASGSRRLVSRTYRVRRIKP